MTETLPDSIEPFTNISSKAYEHPADRAATAALKAIPMLDVVVRKLIEWSYERALRQSYLGTSVKVSERQLPELHAALVAACRTLDMPAIYDLYVTSPVPGSAMAIGSVRLKTTARIGSVDPAARRCENVRTILRRVPSSDAGSIDALPLVNSIRSRRSSRFPVRSRLIAETS